jgi:branched-chain amino acid transport system substrate-binding protein
MLGAGLAAVKGDFKQRDALQAAMAKAVVDSPRGKFSLSPQHNPVQDMFLREAVGNNNELRGVAVKALADPGRGCKM